MFTACLDRVKVQTFCTVVVSSRHSWMILFLMEVKSLMPVRGVLTEKRTDKVKSGPGKSIPASALVYGMRRLRSEQAV